MSRHGVTNVDPFNILSALESNEATRVYLKELSIEGLQDVIDLCDVIGRDTVEEYKVLVKNVLDAAMRRDIMKRLRDCEIVCSDRSVEDVQQKIYAAIDDVMVEYSTTDEVPAYADVVDDCWEEIKARQGDGVAGIRFKFPTLNDYVTIERGELVTFCAGPKEGKSILLLNCAVDLLRKDCAVLYLDSELGDRLFTARLLAHLSGVEFGRLNAGNYTPEEEQRIEEQIAWLKTRKFTHLYIPMFDVQTIYTAVKRVMHTQGLDVLIVD